MRAFGSLAAILWLFAAQSAHAADPAVEKPVRDFVGAFNKADVTAAEVAFVASPTLSDELAPHLWTGPGAVRAWYGALAKDMKDHGDTDIHLTLAVPTREVVSGDRAYLIFPAILSFKAKAKTMREEGQITIVTTRTGGAWKIASWTWSSAS